MVEEQPFRRRVFGYALTEGVDKNFWDTWLEQNKDAAYVVGKLVFAMPNNDRA